MKFGNYVKDKIGILLINIASAYLLSLFLIMLQNQMSAVVLIDIAWFMVLTCVLITDYVKRKQYFKKLESIIDKLDKPYLFSTVMPVGNHMEDKIYHEFLMRSNKSVIEAIAEKEIEQEDYRNFIESWVHEIKTPITSAMLMCENKDESLLRMKLELQLVEQQVDMVLYYARMENANVDYLIHPYDLRRIVSGAIQKNRTYLREHQAQIEMDMEETIVSTDEKWVEFILTQFITNSIKYKSDRPLHIHFWTEEKDEQIVLHMEDHGVGIAREEIEKIFDKGYTGKNGRKNSRSTGMGLYLCKRLCEKLKIGIHCESEVGEYTRMSLVFPNSTFYEGAKHYKNEIFR